MTSRKQIIAEPARCTPAIDWRATILRGERLTASDVSKIRNDVFPFGLLTKDDAEELFRLERSLLDKSPEWSRLFVEMIVDFVVWGERPTGTIADARARWLIDQFDAGPTEATRQMLVTISEEAVHMPRWLRAAIRARVGQGSGTREHLRVVGTDCERFAA